MTDQYRALFNKAYNFIQEKRQESGPAVKTYKFSNDVKTLACAPEVVENILTVHRLTDYKNMRIVHEVNVSITIPIEALVEEVDPECSVFSLSKVRP